MADFGSIEDLMATLNQVLPETLEEVGEELVQPTKDKVQEVVYDAGDPVEHDRKYRLKESIFSTETTKEEGMFLVSIEHDKDIASGYHSDIKPYNSVDDFLPFWINEGKIGLIYGTGFWTEDRSYFEKMAEEINSENLFLKLFQESMKTKGFDVR